MSIIRQAALPIALVASFLLSGCSSSKPWEKVYAPARNVANFDFTGDTSKRAYEFCASKLAGQVKSTSTDFVKCQERTTAYLNYRIRQLSAEEGRRLSFPTFATELMASAYRVQPAEVRLSNLRRTGGEFYAQAGHPGKPGCGLRAKPTAVSANTPAGWSLVAVKCR